MEPFRVDVVTREPCEYTSQMSDNPLDVNVVENKNHEFYGDENNEAGCKLVLMDTQAMPGTPS